jgi:4-alpha-glucanotransferase
MRLEMEDGQVIDRALRLDRAKVTSSAKVGGMRCVEVTLSLPRGLPYGYHRLCVEAGGRQMRAWLICAPRKAFAPDQGPGWGVFLPLYALHSKRSWGIGDYTDLRSLIEWAGSKGAGVVATLPLLPAFLDTPFVPSPYEPVSRLFWSEAFVDPEAPWPGDEAPRVEPATAEEARALLQAPEVDYATVMRLKRRVLEAQAQSLDANSPAGRSMDEYLASRPEVGDYAAFRAAMERLGPDWRAWRKQQREGHLSTDDYEAATARYYAFAQWRAHSQMHEACEAADSRGMRSYLDLPVGVHPQGYDAWRYQDVFAKGMSVGAPPDLLSTHGQNWDFQPLIPQKLRESGYEYVVRYLRHYFASAKMLRIDHAIGLHRLYWIPEGATGRDGVFIRQPAEEMYAVLCLESMRNQAVVVAEDLGLVPPEVRRGLQTHGIGGMYVQMFEMTGRRERPLRKPRVHDVASFSTHDLPTFAAYWQDDDLKQRESLGLLAPERVREEVTGRNRDRRALVTHLEGRGLVQDESDVGQVYRGSTALLAESDAAWVLLNIEDAWEETKAQNLPGTTSEQHANWVARSRYGVDEFDSVEGLTKAIDTVKLYRRPITRQRTFQYEASATSRE